MSLLLNCSKVAFKYLSSVAIDKYLSNQYKVNGIVAFKKIFGKEKQEDLSATITYITSKKQPFIMH